MEMLQEMHTKSVAAEATVAAELANLQQTCQENEGTKTAELDELELQVQSLESEVAELQVQVGELQTNMLVRERDITSVSSQLEAARLGNTNQTSAFAQDLVEFNLAIAAVDRALLLLHTQQQQQASLLAVGAHAGVVVQDAAVDVSASRVAGHRYMPDDGGMAKDEHIFDDLDSLSTATAGYTGGSHGAEDVLNNLRTKFESEKTALVDREQSSRETFQATEQTLQEQLTTMQSTLDTERTTLSASQGDLAAKEQELAHSTTDKATAEAYLKNLKEDCDTQTKAFEELQTLHKGETEALTRAMDLLAEQAGGGSEPLALLHISPAPAPAANASAGAQQALSLLRSRAQSLRSTDLGKLVRRLGSVTQQRGKDSDDPLAEVKVLVMELITRLQQQAAEEATHKAWCDAELSRNREESSVAKEDGNKHTAKAEQLVGDIAKLGLEVEQLNATLLDNEVQRQVLVEQRANRSNESAVAIADAQASVGAVQAALSILEDYFTNLTKALQPLQAVADFMPEPFRSTISMLEVARDGFKTLVEKTQADSAVAEAQAVATLQDLAVADVAAQKDRDFKQVQQQIFTTQLEQAQTDLNISKQELSEAESTYEQLKPPCLNVQTSEERKAQRESEIQALQEAYDMLENYESKFGSSLPQPCFVQGKVLQTRGSLSSLNSSVPEVDSQADQVNIVKTLLAEMRAEVADELAADEQVYEKTKCWCTDTIEQLQTSLARDLDRDGELVKTVEMTTQVKAQLEAELERLQHELAKEQTALTQHTELRQRELQEFHESEKELLVSTHQLSHALGLLRSRYEAAQEPASNATADRERLTAEKEELYAGTGLESKPGEDGAAALLRVAAEVQQALRSLPPQEARVAAQSTEASSALQDFLARPQDWAPSASGGRHAALTEMEAVVSNPGMGQVLGVLEQLLETFETDLQALREKEALDSSQSTELADSKAAQISALDNSISNKQSQLAVKMTEHANAKSDLTYLRETRQADLQQLMDTKQHCARTTQEFELRSTTRQNELQSLDEAIALLAQDDAQTATASVASDDAKTAQLLLHGRSGIGHIFRRPHHVPPSPTRAVLSGVVHLHTAGSFQARAAVVPSPRAPSHREQARAAVVPSPRAPSHREQARAAVVPTPSHREQAPLAQPRQHAPTVSKAQKPLAASSGSRPQGKQRLAAVALHTRLTAARQPSGEALQASLMESMKVVVSEIDKMYTAIEEEGKLEVRMKDTCVSEEHQATQQLERRKTEESGHNATIDRLTASISRIEPEIASLQEEIQTLNSSMATMEADVVQEYEKIKEAVVKQQAHQAKLHQAMLLLRQRYDSSADPLLQFQVIQIKNASASNSSSTNKTVRSSNSSSSEKPTSHVTQPPPTFSRPLRTHAGGTGILSILELLIHDSEQTVASLVREEAAMNKEHTAALNDAQESVTVKDQQLIELGQARGNAEFDLQEAESARAACMEEQRLISEFLAVVADKCNTLLANFASNQELRAEDLRGLREARLVLLVPAGGAAALQVPVKDHLSSSLRGSRTSEPHRRGRGG